jgi:cell division septation protein DedD
VIAQEHLAEVQDTDSAVAEVETVTTWRDALLAHLRPADHRISDEEIFAILNDADEGGSTAELCASSGVTLPMYCVWKSKYRQLGLDELRQARRREQRRRYTVIGLVLLAATLSIGGVVAGISWAVLSAIAGSSVTPPATAPVASYREDRPATAPTAPQIVAKPASEVVAKPASQVVAKPASPIVAPASRVVAPPASQSVASAPQERSEADATIAETGYRIQVTAADSDQQGRAMVAKLTSAGYPAYTTRAVVGTREVFRVRVGPFETLPEAEKVAARLRSAGHAGVWIAR